eukprot:scaffold12229_cov112-Isochrysis_galbana.AAC.1
MPGMTQPGAERELEGLSRRGRVRPAQVAGRCSNAGGGPQSGTDVSERAKSRKLYGRCERQLL